LTRTEHAYNEKELLQQVAEGNEKAFGLLFAQYWDHLFAFAFSVTKSTVLAEEIVQDSFVATWQHRETLPGLEKFEAWLFIVARNQAYKVIRKKVNDPIFVEQLEIYFALSSDSPERQLLLRETQELIGKAAGELPPQQQLVFNLSRQQGLSLDEIAVELGLSKNTVKAHLAKALITVRHYLNGRVDGILLICCLFELF
jgi:RNA polymerase sigma-70 factor (ECF subfamily)